MKYHQRIEMVYFFVAVFFLIGLIWESLEMILYGEIQHRAVDDIIHFLWFLTSWYAYQLGYSHGTNLE